MVISKASGRTVGKKGSAVVPSWRVLTTCGELVLQNTVLKVGSNIMAHIYVHRLEECSMEIAIDFDDNLSFWIDNLRLVTSGS